MQVFNKNESIGSLSKISDTVVELSESTVVIGGQQFTETVLQLDSTISGAGGIDDGSKASGRTYNVFMVNDNSVRKLIASLEDSPLGFTGGLVGQVTYNNSTVFLVVEEIKRINKNWIINGDFQVSQRGDFTTSATYINGKYGIDRWQRMARNTLSGNCSFIHDPVNKTIKATANIDSDTVEGFYCGHIQQVEDFSKFAGREATVSCWMKSNSIAAGLGYYDGVNGDRGAKHSGGGEWEFLTYTFISDVAATKIQTQVMLDNEGGTGTIFVAGDYIEIKEVKLELGSIATEFVSKSYAEELDECMRYYQFQDWIYYDTVGTGYNELTTKSYAYHAVKDLPVRMRAIPSTSWGMKQHHTGVDLSSKFTVFGVTDQSVHFRNSTSFTENGDMSWTYTADAEIY